MWVTILDGSGNHCPLSKGVLQFSDRDTKLLQYEHSFPGLVPHNQDVNSALYLPVLYCFQAR